MKDLTVLEQITLGEISGKNAAIHAYDKIIWTIRSGYLTLLFVGWSILLKSFVENKIDGAKLLILVVCMFLVSLGITIGGYVIDLNYLRRKFRVIYALNNLIAELKDSDGDVETVTDRYLMVSGDDGGAEYDSKGYRQASLTGRILFFFPLIFLALVSVVVCYR